jgi:hypothetical protein
MDWESQKPGLGLWEHEDISGDIACLLFLRTNKFQFRSCLLPASPLNTNLLLQISVPSALLTPHAPGRPFQHPSSSSSVWDRRLPTECTAAYLGLLYEPRFSFPLLSPGALHVRWRDRPLSAKGGTMGEKCPINLAYNCDFHGDCRVLLMPQICDMGQRALLPLRKKACWGFFCPEKSDCLRRVWTRLNYTDSWDKENALLFVDWPI